MKLGATKKQDHMTCMCFHTHRQVKTKRWGWKCIEYIENTCITRTVLFKKKIHDKSI